MPSQAEIDAQTKFLYDFEQASQGLAPEVIEEVMSKTMLAAEKQKEIKEAEQKTSKSGMDTFFGYESALEGTGGMEGDMSGKDGMVPAGEGKGSKNETGGTAANDRPFPTGKSNNTSSLMSSDEIGRLFPTLPEEIRQQLAAPSPSWLSAAERTEYAAFAQMMMRTAGNRPEPLHAFAASCLERDPMKLYELQLIGLVCPCGEPSCPLEPKPGH